MVGSACSQFSITTLSCLNPKDLKFYGDVNAYRKWHTKRIAKSPKRMIEQFLIFQVALRKKTEAVGLRTPSSSSSDRFRVSPVKMRISPSVTMLRALSHEMQAPFQAKMLRFFLVHDGMLHNCTANWVYAFMSEKAAVVQEHQTRFQAEQERKALDLRRLEAEHTAQIAAQARMKQLCDQCDGMIEHDGQLVAVIVDVIEIGRGEVEDISGRRHEVKASRIFSNDAGGVCRHISGRCLIAYDQGKLHSFWDAESDGVSTWIENIYQS